MISFEDGRSANLSQRDLLFSDNQVVPLAEVTVERSERGDTVFDFTGIGTPTIFVVLTVQGVPTKAAMGLAVYNAILAATTTRNTTVGIFGKAVAKTQHAAAKHFKTCCGGNR